MKFNLEKAKEQIEQLSVEKLREMLYDYLVREVTDSEYGNEKIRELEAARREAEIYRTALLRIANFGHGAGCDSSAPIYECGCYGESQWDIAKKALRKPEKERRKARRRQREIMESAGSQPDLKSWSEELQEQSEENKDWLKMQEESLKDAWGPEDNNAWDHAETEG